MVSYVLDCNFWSRFVVIFVSILHDIYFDSSYLISLKLHSALRFPRKEEKLSDSFLPSMLSLRALISSKEVLNWGLRSPILLAFSMKLRESLFIERSFACRLRFKLLGQLTDRDLLLVVDEWYDRADSSVLVNDESIFVIVESFFSCLF